MLTIKLAWTPPTLNVDGTPLTDLGGYKLYRALGSGPSTLLVSLGLVTVFTDDQVPSVSQAVTYTAAATDTKGNEGPKSNNATVTIDVNPPAAPTGLTAVLQ